MAQQRRGGRRRRKVDFIAANHIEYIDYKDTDLLRRFISERGKIFNYRHQACTDHGLISLCI